jgi:hypothetical protein
MPHAEPSAKPAPCSSASSTRQSSRGPRTIRDVLSPPSTSSVPTTASSDNINLRMIAIKGKQTALEASVKIVQDDVKGLAAGQTSATGQILAATNIMKTDLSTSMRSTIDLEIAALRTTPKESSPNRRRKNKEPAASRG